MLHEEEAIPYAATPLLGERLLVLAPHPDDEVIGCGGVVAHHLRERRQVRIAIATDGCAATDVPDTEAYRSLREEESRRGVTLLGDGATIDFLRYPDRSLDSAIAVRLREILAEYGPDLILVPSPAEIHPDHVALARAFCELLQGDPMLVASIAVARIAFYEVSNPLRPSMLVDITDVASTKFSAVAAHESQTTIRDYVAFAKGLNAYRAMSLPPSVAYAEAYRLYTPQEIHTRSFSNLRSEATAPPEIDVIGEHLPVTVIVRTKDRPALLKEAIQSIHATRYPANVIVVNDGGATPDVPAGVTLISHERSHGRSDAMNAGVKAATTPFIAFLDDDDLFYPEHLDVLTTAASGGSRVAWYTDAVSVHLRTNESGRQEPAERLRTFAQDYDPALLLVDNYIPLPTLLVHREDYLAVGGFDPAFDLFEDWDFLIRLSQRGSFQRIPRVTVEVRHFALEGSIILAAPEGSPAFRKAKLQVWDKHRALLTHEVFATVVERQKRRISEAHARAIDETGRRTHVELDVARFEREKESLLGQLAAANNTASERWERISDLDRSIEWLHYDVLTERNHVAELESVVGARDRAIAEMQQVIDSKNNELRVTYAEIGRLQGLLDMIFGSKTWKMHRLMEKLRGR